MHGFNCAEARGILVSLTKDQTHVPCVGRQILKPLGHQRSPWIIFMSPVYLILLEHLSVGQFLWPNLYPLHPWVSPPVPRSAFRQSSPMLFTAAAAAAKSLQSCPTLCNPRDGSPPGSPVPGFLQARTLEWFAISFSSAGKWKVKVKSLSRAWPSVTPWTAAFQAPPSMGFSSQEYWSGVALPPPDIL